MKNRPLINPHIVTYIKVYFVDCYLSTVYYNTKTTLTRPALVN